MAEKGKAAAVADDSTNVKDGSIKPDGLEVLDGGKSDDGKGVVIENTADAPAEGDAPVVDPNAERMTNLENTMSTLANAVTSIADKLAAPADDPAAEAIKNLPPMAEQLFKDPDAFIQRLKDEISGEVNTKQQQADGMKAFWDEVFEEGGGLTRKTHMSLANAVMQENLGTIGKLPASEAAKKLSELTKAKIVEFAKGRTSSDDGDTRVQLEGAGKGTSETAGESKEEDGKPRTLNNILKDRKDAHRKASTT